jgi:hypothetical protein
MYSVTMQGWPRSYPMSWIVTMLSWFPSRPVARASRLTRASWVVLWPLGSMTAMATSRSSDRSWARPTRFCVPPPPPRSSTIS